VLPDAARVEERLAQLARAQGFVAGAVACSVADLERELVREARRSGKCPAPASPQALLLALREAAREHSQGPFFRIREQPGYAGALGDLLASLAQGLLDPAELLSLEVPERVTALARTLLAVRKRLDSVGLAEPQRAVRLAVEALERGGSLPALLARVSELQFEGILDWTPLRLRLALALSSRLPVRVRLPWSPAKPELTEAMEPTLRAFEKLGEGPELELYDPAEGPLAPFLQRLFAPSGEPQEGPVELVSCASPAAQAREVARRCAALLGAGAAPESIAVAARTLAGGVAEELAAALERVGIPWRERRGRPALPAAPVRLALSLLELVEQEFPREALIDLLSSRLLWMREEGEHLPPQAVARVLREAHVRDDATDGGHAGRLSALAARRERKAKGIDDVRETAARVQRALAALRTLPNLATLRDHGAALLSLLARWGLQKRLRSPEPEASGPALERAAAGALARDQAAVRALEEACAGLARGAAQVGLAERRFARGEWAQLLASSLAGASLPPGGGRGGAVQLVELREASERAFDHLLVVGLVDGELPARPATDPLLSDEDRRAVNRAARRAVFRAPPADAQEAAVLPPRQAEEPLLFQLALATARKSVALLFPRADGQGRETLRSPFVDEAARALGRGAESVPIASIPLAHDCAGASDLLARAALDAFAEPAFRVSPPPDAASARKLLSALAGSPLAPRLQRIARAAQAERERVRAFIREIEPGRFSGRLSGAALQAVAKQFEFGPEAPASAHQLEENGTCAFRTFGHRVLRVATDDEDDTELGNRQRGTLLHRCLERFFARLRDEGRLPLRGVPEETALLRQVAQAEMEAFAAEEYVGHRALWELKRGPLIDELIALIETEAGARPLELERRFGFADPDSWPALRLPPPAGGAEVHVRGAVDRVDRAPGGGLVVLDYKSSRIESLRRKLRPDTLLQPEFQLAIYAALLRQREPAAQVDAQYVSLKSARRTPTLAEAKIDLPALLELDPARRTELRAQKKPNLADAVFERVEAMRRGLFEVRPLDCAWCDLKPACRLVALPTDPDENGGEVPRA
jgi:RecB family exonuclease